MLYYLEISCAILSVCSSSPSISEERILRCSGHSCILLPSLLSLSRVSFEKESTAASFDPEFSIQIKLTRLIRSTVETPVTRSLSLRWMLMRCSTNGNSANVLYSLEWSPESSNVSSPSPRNSKLVISAFLISSLFLFQKSMVDIFKEDEKTDRLND